jgi:hypothetical protein
MKRMKQWIAILLTLCLALPAGAAEFQDDLGRVTLLAKSQLDIGDSYTKFSGYPREGLSRTWSLSWSSDEESVWAELDDEGLVLSYRLNRNSDYNTERYYGYAPTLPSLTKERAEEIAKTYANKLLGDRESADLTLSGGNMLSSGSYYCYGFIRIDGLPTSMNLSVTVAEDGTVTSYNRTNPAEKYLKDAPSSIPSVTAAQAHLALAEKLALKLEYVMGDEGIAVLRYIPVWGDQFIVDAGTGKLINLTELYSGVYDYYGRGNDEKSLSPAAEDSSSSIAGGLTETEIAGTEKLKGALDSAALDAKLAAIPELGLPSYTLSRTDYYFAAEDKLIASLRYTLKGSSEDNVARKYITVDAMTGELMSLYSSRNYEDGKIPEYSTSKAKGTAESFLTRLFAANFAKTALYSGDSLSLVYAQKEQGYFYPANQFSIDIDPVDGSIASFYYSFDDTVKF